MIEEDFMASAHTMDFKRIIRPRSIVIVGASSNPGKPGGSITKNLVDSSFAGDLYLVNRNGETIRGIQSHSAVADLPANIDLAIIAIPARGVYQEMQNLSDKNCRAVIVLTAGFGEAGEWGKSEEQRLLQLAEDKRMTMIGPNCVGIVTPYYCGKFAGILPQLKRGSIDLVSASGATVDYLLEQAGTRGLHFANVISCGNSAQYGVEDVIEMLDQNHGADSARIKMLYLEEIKKPTKLLKHVRSLTRKGCILLGIKSGVTDAGRRAAASHTGAMASDDTVVQALFDKAGIIRVRSKYELIELGCALNLLQGLKDTKKICIITDAGGPGVMLADELSKFGLELPTLKNSTQQIIGEFLPPHATLANPVDCLPTQTGEQIRKIISTVEAEKEDLDAIVVLTGNSMLTDKWECYSNIIESMDHCSIPIIPVLSSATTCSSLIEKFMSAGKTYFIDEVKIGKALGRIHKRTPLFSSAAELKGYKQDEIAAVLDGTSGVLEPTAGSSLLAAAGFKQPAGAVAKSWKELADAAHQMCWPVAVKIIGALHKSDVGGVAVGIDSDDEVLKAWERMVQIDGFDGVLVQEMVAGPEVIIGATKEEGFGHLVMFGLGGIFTEILRDNQFALAPLGLEESTHLIRSIRSIKVLEGARGQAGMDIDLLADYVSRLSQLVSDFPQISEIDFNPVKGEGGNLAVVDCRIII